MSREQCYRFNRYVNGELKAEGIKVFSSSEADAVKQAIQLIYPDERTETVLVLCNYTDALRSRAEASAQEVVPKSLLNALRNWTGAEPSQSVLARAVDNWLASSPKQQ